MTIVRQFAPTLRRLLVARGFLGVAFAPGDEVGISSSYDGTVRLRDFRAAKEQAILLRGTTQVTRFTLSPDGRVLATCHSDGTIHLSRLRVR